MTKNSFSLSVLLLAFHFLGAQTPSRYDIIIDEIFPDPSPSIGLPNAEFIELKNVSQTSYNLRNWQISHGTSTATIKKDVILQPDSFVIICSASAAIEYKNFGSSIGIPGFPSLNNNGNVIFLKSPSGLTVHAIAYNKSWYHNDIKSAGGWSIEMIDTKNPCAGSDNWKASIDARGGTPGQKNSVDGIYKDNRSPNLSRTYTINDTTIVAVFDKTVDSSSASQASNYDIDNGFGNPISVRTSAPLFNEAVLNLSSKLQASTLYHLNVTGITDCSGNIIKSNTAKVGLPVLADTNDIVINEILFNPKTNGYDYVEFYNKSNKITDMQQLYVATREVTGALKSIVPLSPGPLLFFPGEYYVITENKLWVEQNYLVQNPDRLLQLGSLPSFPDDDGIVVVLNQGQTALDELHYEHNWQLALISNEEGIALERIDYNKPTQEPANWASAASTAGFGTPTYQNSQFKIQEGLKGEITVAPKIFSPDNDGYEDYCFINYQLPNSGFLSNITIYDASGRPVRFLANNSTLALTGSFKWDGLDDQQQRLPVGVYIIITQVFDLRGKTKQFKNVVTLARRL
ncbi:MAG: lamin tail domain-containing protein [Bacteroidetes bacterium]|nr:lamin tail domain-containing protein [Bacteroidota bacterium]MBS1973693.1 lamin tail domain-containing protein [Bacteroidota bacterium]